MSEFLNPLQTAVYNRLVAQLSSTSVYDSPPNQLDGKSDDGFPFVVIGDDTSAPFDTDTSTGASATVTIHCWSRMAGRKQVKNLMGQVYTALNRQAASLTAAGYAFIDSLFEFSEIIQEADGKTKHGVIRFRITMEKT